MSRTSTSKDHGHKVPVLPCSQPSDHTTTVPASRKTPSPASHNMWSKRSSKVERDIEKNRDYCRVLARRPD
ncbi:hypothetical protein CABS01_16602 [Colletotrichum abscissum]|uniref:Uncharacterized protein n=1 Tax=Colletotrichum abscissum TaxID=1671311 RepID=A0A9P9XEE1_9PEZI|nr:uncharacterized protein CABS01_16602 [Colletotrichum abscissum]KAI3551024.1 hypothetical protein CABS02_07367 [Colletotrichum abscissum]KAK1519299.1 hypothetical protein CABS01_16602 [Colletotrichum abscissum]